MRGSGRLAYSDHGRSGGIRCTGDEGHVGWRRPSTAPGPRWPVLPGTANIFLRYRRRHHYSHTDRQTLSEFLILAAASLSTLPRVPSSYAPQRHLQLRNAEVQPVFRIHRRSARANSPHPRLGQGELGAFSRLALQPADRPPLFSRPPDIIPTVSAASAVDRHARRTAHSRAPAP